MEYKKCMLEGTWECEYQSKRKKEDVVQTDPVNHPAHYTSHPSGVEAIQVCEHHNFCIGNAIKYLWRAGQKGDGGKHVEDLRKAIWYINREIQRLDGKHDTD